MENQGPEAVIQNQANLNLPAGTFSRAPDHPKSPATVKREAEQVRKSCSGQSSGGAGHESLADLE